MYSLTSQLNTPLFVSLRSSYDRPERSFNKWFHDKAQTGRKAWIARTEQGSIEAICIYAMQTHEVINDAKESLQGLSLKLCTFKVGEQIRGRKIGELFLKAAFRFATDNRCENIFVHTSGDQFYLLELLSDFGFQRRGVYGTDGHYLFAYDTNATGAPVPVAALPPYAHAVDFHYSGFMSVDFRALGANSTDPAFLADPRGGPPRLGYASTGGDGSQGIPVVVNLTNAGPPVLRNISLYFSSTRQPTAAVDPYQTGGPSMVLRVMDLNTLNPVAPDVRIDSFDGGVYYWVTIRCGASDAAACGVRVRAMQVDGTNTVSAVFFDTAQ